MIFTHWVVRIALKTFLFFNKFVARDPRLSKLVEKIAFIFKNTVHEN